MIKKKVGPCKIYRAHPDGGRYFLHETDSKAKAQKYFLDLADGDGNKVRRVIKSTYFEKYIVLGIEHWIEYYPEDDE